MATASNPVSSKVSYPAEAVNRLFAPPEREVTAKQDPDYTKADFLRDLRRASSNRAKPSPEPARRSSRRG